MNAFLKILSLSASGLAVLAAQAQESEESLPDSITLTAVTEEIVTPGEAESFSLVEIRRNLDRPFTPMAEVAAAQPDFTGREKLGNKGWARGVVPSIYSLPYSMTGRAKDWRRLWINTGVLTGAFVGTLFVLECLPEDATTWNRAALQEVPLFKRWKEHVIEKGPEWDHDKFIFNYVLHPYAGAVYFMSARSVGFNFWQSFLYSSIISNVGWEFGIEAFMERPSYQDLFITPIVGSAIGEGFYKLKRHLVRNDYRLFGSPIIGNVVAFLIDPVNEVVGIFDHNPARAEARRLKAQRGEQISFVPMVTPGYAGFSLAATF